MFFFQDHTVMSYRQIAETNLFHEFFLVRTHFSYLKLAGENTQQGQLEATRRVENLILMPDKPVFCIYEQNLNKSDKVVHWLKPT